MPCSAPRGSRHANNGQQRQADATRAPPDQPANGPTIRYFPIFLDLRHRRALVLGNGPVASRKAEALARAGAEVLRAAAFRPGLLIGCALAVGADAPEEDLRALSAAAHGGGIPVNIVDRPDLCSFISPAVVDRDPITVAISSGGTAPSLARDIRARIEAALPPGLGRIAALLGDLRAELRAALPDPTARRQAIDGILAGPAAQLALDDDMAAARVAALQVLESPADQTGIVFLIGAGPGDPDLLTLRAHRLLGEADAIVHGAQLGRAMLDMGRRDADRIIAEPPQRAGLLIRLAREGRRVACLLPGSPDAETETLALSAAGVAFAIVPGVLLRHPSAVDG